MSGFGGLFSGGSQKTDRANQLAGVGAGWNVYNRGLPLADTMTTGAAAPRAAGSQALSNAQSYWQNILSGNRQSAAMAAAPVVNTVLDKTDAATSEQGKMGTARGGGTNAANQQIQQTGTKQIADATASLPAEAAKELGTIGEAQSNISHQDIAQALQSLGLDASVANEIIDSSIKSRPISKEAHDSVLSSWSNVLASIGL